MVFAHSALREAPMSRAVLLSALVAVTPALPEGCAKLLPKKSEAAPAPSLSASAVASVAPVATATTAAPATTITAPPIWAPPDTGAPPSPPPVPSESPDLAKARALDEAGEYKKLRALLEKKVKAGKADQEEAGLLLGACVELGDNACVALTRAKYPGAEPPN